MPIFFIKKKIVDYTFSVFGAFDKLNILSSLARTILVHKFRLDKGTDPKKLLLTWLAHFKAIVYFFFYIKIQYCSVII